MSLLALILAGLALLLAATLRGRLRELEEELDTLKARLRRAERASTGAQDGSVATEDAGDAPATPKDRPPPATEETDPADPIPPPLTPDPGWRGASAPDADREEPAPAGPPEPEEAPVAARADSQAPPRPAEKRSAKPRGDARWKRLERQLVENWTGILGAVVLVAGITFVGGYAGLGMSPFLRSLMIAAAGVALLAGAHFVRTHDDWHAIARWLRSAGAAVVLLACFGSSAIPGLAWLDGLAPALALLLLGIGVNLGVAHRAGEQPFAALHVVLSLVPLLLVPQSFVTLFVATVVAATGVRLAWDVPWRSHILVTLVTYGGFHLVWFDPMVPGAPGIWPRLAGGIAAVLVCAFTAARQHRQARPTEAPAALDQVVQVANWVLLGAALAAYTGDTALRGVALLAAGGVLFFLAGRARRSGVRWMHIADTLAAEALVLWGLVALRPYAFHWLLIPALAFALAALFHRLGLGTKEPVLERWGVYLLRVSGATLVVAAVLATAIDGTLGTQHAAILFVTAVFGATYHVYLLRMRGEFETPLEAGADPPEHSPPSGAVTSALVTGLVALLASLNLSSVGWTTLAGVQAGVALISGANRARSRLLAHGALVVLGPVVLLAWIELLDQPPVAEQLTEHLAALVLGALLVIWLASPRRVGRLYRPLATYALGATVAVAATSLLEPIHPLLPLVAWLVASVVALEAARRVGLLTRPLLHVGWGFLAVFAWGFASIVVPGDASLPLGPVRLRMLVEAGALAVLGVWAMRQRSPALEALPEWRWAGPLAVEAIVAWLGLIVLLEVGPAWLPVGWLVLAMVAAASFTVEALPSRLRLYAVGYFWAGAYQLVLLRWIPAPGSGSVFLDPVLTGVVAIAAQVAFLAVLAPRLELEEVALPPPVAWLESLLKGAARHLPAVLYYPTFGSVAFFLSSQFDASLLTLLWAVEAFVVFGVSLLLRENHFRYAALAALALVMARLLVFDLAQSNLGVRGLVFIGVGALMLGMNSLYNRYKDRYA